MAFTGQLDPVTTALMVFGIIILLAILFSMIRVVREYERVVVFRLGRVIGAKGPGLVIILPIIDRIRIVDLRVITVDVPKQRIITRDNIPVDVDAVVYFRVNNPLDAVLKVRDFYTATSMIAQTTLRDTIGQVEFDELLTRREELNKQIQQIIDDITEPWGVKVTSVNIRDVILPVELQRAIAKQAEAERERRARITLADGELKAAEKMLQAAGFYAQSPQAMRLRELQTWAEIAREKNMIVVAEGMGATSQIGLMAGLLRSQQEGRGRKKD